MYMNSNNIFMSMKDIDVEYKRGQFYLGKDFAFMPSPPKARPVRWSLGTRLLRRTFGASITKCRLTAARFPPAVT